jgi:hypothetical protein
MAIEPELFLVTRNTKAAQFRGPGTFDPRDDHPSLLILA